MEHWLKMGKSNVFCFEIDQKDIDCERSMHKQNKISPIIK